MGGMRPAVAVLLLAACSQSAVPAVPSPSAAPGAVATGAVTPPSVTPLASASAAPRATASPSASAAVAPSGAPAAAAPAARSACALPSSVTWNATSGEYAGPIFDSHLHLFVDRRLVPTNTGSEGLCRFLDRLGFMAALGFYALPAASPPRSNLIVSQSAPLIEGARARIVPMLEMGTDVPDLFSAQSTFARGQFSDAVLQGYLAPSWVFQGIGEIPENVWQSPGIDSAPMQVAVRDVNAKRGVMMIHAYEAPVNAAAQRAKIDAVVASAPNVTFLFHGGKNGFDLVEPVIQKYRNVYFSWDGGPGWMVGSWGSLMHPGATPQNPTGTGGTTQQFLADMQRIGIDAVVNENIAWLASRLQKYPDRITGAMDLNAAWHFDDASSELIGRTFRKIVAKLPADLQERYAYRNAMAVFGGYLGR